ncbi:uncharacterized protein UTRI_05164 [Ustilago trichophora]|uniref:Uncharacterized protein n=1 Tax=Ustilago trichophora TaxID=86804 RepID=A0A5C3EED6_9BASI|nr:uncharacterized protein UTRI_05164 [Ustilago trichophora]
MNDSIYVAANCLVPLDKVEAGLMTNIMKLTSYFEQLNRFSEADKRKHVPEEDDNLWISAIYKVPVEEIATMVKVFRGLPYFQTLTFPDKKVATDESFHLKSYAKFSALFASESGSTPVNAEAESIVQPAIQIDAQQASEVQVNPEDQPAISTPLVTEAENTSVPQSVGSHTETANVAEPPLGVAFRWASILGRWNLFRGRGDVTVAGAFGIHVPRQARFTPLGFIANRLSTEEFWTNIYGIVGGITPLRKTRKMPHWRIELVDPIRRAESVHIFLFPADDTDAPLGSPLPGLRSGDHLVAFDVHVPRGLNLVGVYFYSTIFLPVDSEAMVSTYRRRARTIRLRM